MYPRTDTLKPSHALIEVDYLTNASSCPSKILTTTYKLLKVMSTEVFTVIYRIFGDESNSKYPNMVYVTAGAMKEILLLDILLELPESVGYMHEFWALRSSSGTYVQLKSPTCVVPAIGRAIDLYLIRSNVPPYVPVKQALLFNEKSRSTLYNVQSYLSATKQLKKVIKEPFSGNQMVTNTRRKFTSKKIRQQHDNHEAQYFSGDSELSQFPNSSPVAAVGNNTTTSSHYQGYSSNHTDINQGRKVKGGSDGENAYSDNRSYEKKKSISEKYKDASPPISSSSNRSSSSSRRYSSDSSNYSDARSAGVKIEVRRSSSDRGNISSSRDHTDRDSGTGSGSASQPAASMALGGITADDIASTYCLASKKLNYPLNLLIQPY